MKEMQKLKPEKIQNLQIILSKYAPNQEFSKHGANQLFRSNLYSLILAIEEKKIYILKNTQDRPITPEKIYLYLGGPKTNQKYRDSMKEYLSYWFDYDKYLTGNLSTPTYETLANFLDSKII